MQSRTLVTLILLSYRQEKFIREAVEGALMQTYSPLEIIFSDDCSPDRTFEIMQEIVDSYQGPHTIVLHRNPINLGLCGNLNGAIALSTGELIVTAGGDDICYPDRCQVLADAWMASSRQWHSICSNANLIDENGKSLGIYNSNKSIRECNEIRPAIRDGVVGVSGCSHAFSRINYEIFGPLPSSAPGEDEILGFRSLLLGGIRWIPAALLSYRKHPAGLYKDQAALRKMGKKARSAAIREDEFACTLRHELYTRYLKIAADKGVISQEIAAEYSAILTHRFPYHQFTITCKNSVFHATWRLILIIVSGKYRSGMLAHFKHTYIKFGPRSFVRGVFRDRKAHQFNTVSAIEKEASDL